MLPTENLFAILANLNPRDLIRTSAVCREWNLAANTDSLWQQQCSPIVKIMKAKSNLSLKKLFAKRSNADRVSVRRPIGREGYMVAAELYDPCGMCIWSTIKPLEEATSSPELLLQCEASVTFDQPVPWFVSGLDGANELWPTVKAYLIRKNDDAMMHLFTTVHVNGGGVDFTPELYNENPGEHERPGWSTFQTGCPNESTFGVVQTVWDCRCYTRDCLHKDVEATSAVTGLRISLMDPAMADHYQERVPYVYNVEQLLQHADLCLRLRNGD